MNLLNDLLVEFGGIINNLQNETKKIDKENSSQWWKDRFKLDQRMEKVLKSIEETIGHEMKIMLNDFDDEQLNSWIEQIFDEMRGTLINEIKNNFKKLLSSTLEEGQEQDILSPALKEDMDQDIIRFLSLLKGISVMSILEQQSEEEFLKQFDTLDRSIYLQMLTKPQQEEFFSAVKACRIKLINCLKNKQHVKRNPVLLWLDEHLQFIPFEYMPLFVSQNQTVIRIPSLEYLRSLRHDQKFMNIKQTSYIFNQTKDSERLQEIFKNQKSWKNLIEEKDLKQSLKQALTQQDLYVYVGDGAGENYLNEEELKDMLKVKSAVLLFGCSSAKQMSISEYISKGEAELHGISIEYLLSNCPFLVGMLWDVSDQDIKLMLTEILEAMTKPGSVTNILDLLSKARNKCKFRYLNGSAFVCYGVPVFFAYP